VIPEFSRTIITSDNRIFCSGGQDPHTMDALGTMFEIDIEEKFRVKEKRLSALIIAVILSSKNHNLPFIDLMARPHIKFW